MPPRKKAPAKKKAPARKRVAAKPKPEVAAGLTFDDFVAGISREFHGVRWGVMYGNDEIEAQVRALYTVHGKALYQPLLATCGSAVSYSVLAHIRTVLGRRE